jgi:hypothetical protein
LSSSLVRLEGSEREICFAPMFREIKGLRLEVATHEILFEDQGPEDPFFFSQAANLLARGYERLRMALEN